MTYYIYEVDKYKMIYRFSEVKVEYWLITVLSMKNQLAKEMNMLCSYEHETIWSYDVMLVLIVVVELSGSIMLKVGTCTLVHVFRPEL